MAVSPTPGQQEYVHDHATQRSVNDSSVSMQHGHFWRVHWIWTLPLLTALVGLVGNSIVLWLLSFRIRRNLFSIYILNLAGADALFLCSSFLVSICEFVRYLCHSFMYRLLQYITYTFYTVSLSFLAAISTERCLSVLFPIWHRCHRPKRTSVAVCAVLWALGGLLEVAYIVICYDDYPGHMKRMCRDYLITEFVWFLLLTCVLCMSSLTLLLRVQCSSQRRQPPRLYLLILLAVLVFLLCGLPMEIGEFLSYFNTVFMPQWLGRLLACLNSSANPFIYFFLGKQMHKKKEPLKVILQRALGDERNFGSGARDTLYTNSLETSF
ncbi:mas-related G-protein coupled receptor member X1-like [Trichosurus vulpecula]|uniref:mas-related G-protein coupled receptor member X1-like n=1 Tax=Trichosurus vulpecula TaxID=9337 RepID=UPI00186AFBCA|nr:mas-related G-protein coupled receptor member X1-like [Trichosurus vulpecula]